MGLFDEMAARYDTPERARVTDAIAAALRQRLAGLPGKTAVDYGCGTGLVGLQLADCFETLLMVDAAPRMIEQVQQKIAAMRLANVQTLCADFTQVVPQGLSADLIFAAQTLLHIPDTRAILGALYGLLNPGGRLLVVDFDKDESLPSDRVHNGFIQADLAGLARRVGFAKARAETFYRGERIFMNKDAALFLLEADKDGAVD